MPPRRLRDVAAEHVVDLSRELAVNVDFIDGWVDPGVTPARAWLVERRIVAPRVRNAEGYYIVLHEFGHFARPPIGQTFYDETNAWLWALDHGRVEPTASALHQIDGVLLDYAVFRLGYRRIDDAIRALPESLRSTPETVYKRIEDGLQELAGRSSGKSRPA